MLIRKVFVFGMTLVISFVAVSCIPSAGAITPPTPTERVVTPTLTQTFVPTSTFTQIWTQTFTVIPPTLTPLPTLPMDLAKMRFEALMLSNGNCGLPCWWGIMPGETSFHEAVEVLDPLRSLEPYSLGKGALAVSYSHGLDEIHMDIYSRTLPKADKVSMLYIRTDVLRPLGNNVSEKILDDQKYSELMYDFTLPRILTMFGPPDQVISQMELNGDGGFPTYLDMRLLYPEKGMIVGYRIDSQLKDPDQVIICPSKSFISLWLTPPSHDTNYQDLLVNLGQNEWDGFFQPDNATILPLDKINNMTLAAFYEKFKQPNRECIIIPRSVWPYF